MMRPAVFLSVQVWVKQTKLNTAHVFNEVGGTGGRMVCVSCKIASLFGKRVEFGFYSCGQVWIYLVGSPTKTFVWGTLECHEWGNWSKEKNGFAAALTAECKGAFVVWRIAAVTCTLFCPSTHVLIPVITNVFCTVPFKVLLVLSAQGSSTDNKSPW